MTLRLQTLRVDGIDFHDGRILFAPSQWLPFRASGQVVAITSNDLRLIAEEFRPDPEVYPAHIVHRIGAHRVPLQLVDPAVADFGGFVCSYPR